MKAVNVRCRAGPAIGDGRHRILRSVPGAGGDDQRAGGGPMIGRWCGSHESGQAVTPAR